MTIKRPLLGRRPFIAAAGAALALPTALTAQAQWWKRPVVGTLHSQERPPPGEGGRSPLWLRLSELGWDLGVKVDVMPMYANGRVDRLPALAATLVERKVDVIITAGSESTRAARQATDTIPIVAIGPDLVAMGYAASLARPGGNVTGPSNTAQGDLQAKRLELLQLAIPAAKRIAYLRQSEQAGTGVSTTVAAARAQGVVLAELVIDGLADYDAAFAALSRQRPDALWVADTAANVAHRSRIIEFAARERLPAIYQLRQFTDSGGLMSYGVSLAERQRRAAAYVDKILRGAKPGDLPIELATQIELVINLKTATEAGLRLPQELLLRADEVIQ